MSLLGVRLLQKQFAFLSVACSVLVLLMMPNGVPVVQVAEGLTCNCNNGKVKIATPLCECECESGYQLPDCDYHIKEDVRLDVYVQTLEFRQDPFMEALSENLLQPVSALKYAMASALPKFNKTNVVVVMPGYVATIFLKDISQKAPWTLDLLIESAYVIPMPASPESVTSRFPVFDTMGYRITVESMMYVLAALILIFLFMCCEGCCCFKNTEDTISEEGYKRDEEEHDSRPPALDGKKKDPSKKYEKL